MATMEFAENQVVAEEIKPEPEQEEEEEQQQKPEEEEEEEQKQEEEEEEKRRHFHVLAVDDSKLDRKILEQLLTVSSYQVTSVESGDKALEYLGLMDQSHLIDSSSHNQGQEINVNLIMTDYSMPGMSGYDLLKKLKGSSWKDVPVVVMSSENVPSIIHMCLEEGAEEFLLKPVQLSDLKKLQPCITRSRTTNEENQSNLCQENKIKNTASVTTALVS